jgi:hypothetical protein
MKLISLYVDMVYKNFVEEHCLIMHETTGRCPWTGNDALLCELRLGKELFF